MGEQKLLGPEEMRSHTLAQPQGSRQVTCRAVGGLVPETSRGFAHRQTGPQFRLMAIKRECLLIKFPTCCSYYK